MRTALLPLVLLLFGCDPSPGQAAADHPVAPAKAFDLRGEWGVSELDGRTLDYRIALKGTDGTLYWEPACAGWGLTYRADGDALTMADDLHPEEQPVCDIGFPEDLPRVIDALEGRWQVEETERGDLILMQGAETITLEKSPVDTVETLAGEWRVVGIDGVALDDQAMDLKADDSAIWWEPRCAGVAQPYRIVNARFIPVEYPAPPPPPPGAEAPPPRAVCAIGLPTRLPDAMAALGAADRIEGARSDTVLISGGGHSVTLIRR